MTALSRLLKLNCDLNKMMISSSMEGILKQLLLAAFLNYCDYAFMHGKKKFTFNTISCQELKRLKRLPLADFLKVVVNLPEI